MKKILKIVSLFLFLFVGSTSMSMAQFDKYAIEGEDVVFDLMGVFEDGEGADKIVKIWVMDPLLGYRDLTTIARYVLNFVQIEQAGLYWFHIKRADGRQEVQPIRLFVRAANLWSYLNEDTRALEHMDRFVPYLRKERLAC